MIPLAKAGQLARTRSQLSKLLLSRLLVATFLVGLGTLILQVTRPELRVGPLYLVLIWVYVLTGVSWAAQRLGLPFGINIFVLSCADLMLVSALIYFSGGTRGPFALFYLLPIVCGAIGLKRMGGVSGAVLASMAYGALVLLEVGGLSGPRIGEWNGPLRSALANTYLHVCLFMLVGYLAGALSEGVQEKTRELADAEREITRIKLDTDSILQNMSSGVMTLGLDGRIVSVNPAAEQILGIGKESLAGRPVVTALEGHMVELARELERDLQNQHNRNRSEIHQTQPDGERKVLGLSTSFLSDKSGKRRGLVAVFQDVTEVRKMQDEVRKADRLAAIGELAASIAHEIRNPLASIRGSIEFLASDMEVNGDNESLMELVIKESDRLEKIITDFLEFARMPPLVVRETSVADALEQTLALLRRHPEYSSDLNIVYKPLAKNAVVRIDEEQIRQVFLNLALNACEAMQGEGTLTVSVEEGLLPDDSDEDARPHLIVVFADDGPGIPPRFLKKIHQPFFSTKDEGTGLGLSIAARIVTGHQGRLKAKNRDDGGAQFEVYLPIVNAKAPAREDLGARAMSKV